MKIRSRVRNINYILLFDNDLISSSIITLSIYKEKPESLVFNAHSTYHALNLLDKISRHENQSDHQQEVCFIVDLNMSSLEGYVFLVTLEHYHSNCPVKVYVLNDETRPDTSYPSILRYQIAGRFSKPLTLEEIEAILNDSSPKYFKNKDDAEQPLAVSARYRREWT